MKAEIENGVLLLTVENETEMDAAYTWFNDFDTGDCAAELSIPADMITADMLGSEVH